MNTEILTSFNSKKTTKQNTQNKINLHWPHEPTDSAQNHNLGHQHKPPSLTCKTNGFADTGGSVEGSTGGRDAAMLPKQYLWPWQPTVCRSQPTLSVHQWAYATGHLGPECFVATTEWVRRCWLTAVDGAPQDRGCRIPSSASDWSRMVALHRPQSKRPGALPMTAHCHRL